MHSGVWTQIASRHLLGTACALLTVQVVAGAYHVNKIYGNDTEPIPGAESGMNFPETSTLGFESARYFHDWRDETVALKSKQVQSITNQATNLTDTSAATPANFLENTTDNDTKCLCLYDASFKETVEYVFRKFVRPNWETIFVVLFVTACAATGGGCLFVKCCKKKFSCQKQNTENVSITEEVSSVSRTQTLQGTSEQSGPTKVPIKACVESRLPCTSNQVWNSSEMVAGTAFEYSDTNKLLADPFVDQTSPVRPPQGTNQERGEGENRFPATAIYPQVQDSTMSMQRLISAMKVSETCLWNLENSTVVITPEMTKRFGQAFDLSGNQIATCESNSKTNTEFLVNVFKSIHNKLGREFTPEKMVDYFKSNDLLLLGQVLEEALADKGYELHSQ